MYILNHRSSGLHDFQVRLSASKNRRYFSAGFLETEMSSSASGPSPPSGMVRFLDRANRWRKCRIIPLSKTSSETYSHYVWFILDISACNYGDKSIEPKACGFWGESCLALCEEVPGVLERCELFCCWWKTVRTIHTWSQVLWIGIAAFSFEHVRTSTKAIQYLMCFLCLGSFWKIPKNSIQSFPSFKLPHSGTPKKASPRGVNVCTYRVNDPLKATFFFEFRAHRTPSGEPWFRASTIDTHTHTPTHTHSHMPKTKQIPREEKPWII